MTMPARRDGTAVIEQLAAYAATDSFERLPADAVRAARLATLDALGVALAGTVEDPAVRNRALIAHRRPAEEATTPGTPPRACAEDAAFANGTVVHALDHDDVQASTSGHPWPARPMSAGAR